MKKTLIVAFSLFSVWSSFSQVQLKATVGEYKMPQPSSCLNDEQRMAIQTEILKSRNQLIQSGVLKDPSSKKQPLAHPLFIWPVVKNPDSPYANTWGVWNYVDHNPNYPNQLQDWNCGTRTYDTSGGYNHT